MVSKKNTRARLEAIANELSSLQDAKIKTCNWFNLSNNMGRRDRLLFQARMSSYSEDERSLQLENSQLITGGKNE